MWRGGVRRKEAAGLWLRLGRFGPQSGAPAAGPRNSRRRAVARVRRARPAESGIPQLHERRLPAVTRRRQPPGRPGRVRLHRPERRLGAPTAGERPALLPLLWSHLNPGGVLFINQLPHRNSPIENHTTGLPLINYLPAGLAHRIALRSKRTEPGELESMLRRGIRGGTANEIVGILEQQERRPHLLEPHRLGMSDRIDLWFEMSKGSRLTGLKRLIKAALKASSGSPESPSCRNSRWRSRRSRRAAS